jgi:hypothetical protein
MKTSVILVLALANIFTIPLILCRPLAPTASPVLVERLSKRYLVGFLGDGDDETLPLSAAWAMEGDDTTITNFFSGDKPGATLGILGQISLGPAVTTFQSYSSHEQPTTSSPIAQSSPTSSTASEAYNTDIPVNATPVSSKISNESRMWEVIGIAVVTISVIATIIFLAVFFDQWWRFLRDVILGKRVDLGVENFVPDWEKACWEVRESYESESPILPPPSTLARQPSAHRQTADPRHPFPARPDPHTILARAVANQNANIDGTTTTIT